MTAIDLAHTRDRLISLGAAAVCDALSGEGWITPMRALWTPARTAGPAFTVTGEPDDNLPLHRAIAEAPAGSVIVAALGGSDRTAVFGDVLARIATERGLGGLVLDGAARDCDGIRELGFPVFCSARSLRGPTKRCWGSLGEPVQIDSVTIAPGDWVLGDGDGVVIMPGDRLSFAVAAAESVQRREDEMVRRAIAGEATIDQLGLRRTEETGGASPEASSQLSPRP